MEDGGEKGKSQEWRHRLGRLSCLCVLKNRYLVVLEGFTRLCIYPSVTKYPY